MRKFLGKRKGNNLDVLDMSVPIAAYADLFIYNSRFYRTLTLSVSLRPVIRSATQNAGSRSIVMHLRPIIIAAISFVYVAVFLAACAR